VDWAFFVNGSLAFLVEAKAAGEEISRYDEQLGAYYAEAQVAEGQPGVNLGILTTGLRWRFFTDLHKDNVMDTEPFFEWDVLKDTIPHEFLAILQRAEFKSEHIKFFAKRKRQQSVLVKELARLLQPSDEFLRFALQHKTMLFNDRYLTEKVIDEWRPIMAAAIREWAEQQALTTALGRAVDAQPEKCPAPARSDTLSPAGEEGEEEEEPERHLLRRKFWTTLLERAKTKTQLHAGISPSHLGWIGTGAGTSGLGYDYVVTKHESNVQLYIDRGKDSEDETKAVFDNLKANQREIERLFGEPLSWEPLEGKRAKRIAKRFALGGYRDDQEKWPEIQDAMINAMICLEKALHPFIDKLEVGA